MKRCAIMEGRSKMKDEGKVTITCVTASHGELTDVTLNGSGLKIKNLRHEVWEYGDCFIRRKLQALFDAAGTESITVSADYLRQLVTTVTRAWQNGAAIPERRAGT